MNFVYLHILFLSLFLFSLTECVAQSGKISVDFVECIEGSGHNTCPLSLYKNGAKVDSLTAWKSSLFTPDVQSSRKKYVFRNLDEGIYTLRYLDVFSKRREKVIHLKQGEKKIYSICLDKLQDSLYKEPSWLTDLGQNDTLFIYAHEFFGEFCSLKRGLFITKIDSLLFWGKLRLQSDGLLDSVNYDIVKKFVNPDSQLIVLSENQENLIHNFLLEVQNYDSKSYYLNPPALYLYFTKQRQLKRTVDHNYRPYNVLIDQLTFPN